MNEELTIDNGIYTIVGREEKPATDLHMERSATGVLGGFAKTEPMGVPIGQAAGALLTVSVWDAIRGLVSGSLPAAIPAWLIPAIGAAVVQSKMIKGFIGADVSNAAGLILTADAIQSLFNVRGLVSGLVGGVKLGQVRAAGATGNNSQSVDDYLKAHGLV